MKITKVYCDGRGTVVHETNTLGTYGTTKAFFISDGRIMLRQKISSDSAIAEYYETEFTDAETIALLEMVKRMWKAVQP